MRLVKEKLIFVFLVFVIISTIFSSTQAQNVEPKVLKAITSMAEADKFRRIVNAYIDDVKEASNGKLIIEIVADKTSAPQAQRIFVLKSGAVDICFDQESLSQITPVYTTEVITGMLPWEDREAGLYDFWREIYAKDAELYWIGRSSQTQWFVIGLNKEIKSIEELTNLKIRANSPNAPAIEALGAVPIVIPSDDIIEGMQRNLIDGFLMTPEDWVNRGYAEVTKYLLNVRLLEGGQSGIFLTLDTWNTLTDEEKGWLQDTFDKNEKIYYAISYWNFASGEDDIPKAGVKIINLPEEEKEKMMYLVRKGVWDSLKEKMKPEYVETFENIVTDLK